MPRKNMEFQLEIDSSIDEVFDEGIGSSFLAMRKLRWSPDGEFKIDLRKWFTNANGEEIAGKGFSFITEDGPNGLVKALLNHNFGDTRDILNGIKDREDFLYNVKDVLDQMGSDIGKLVVVKSQNDDSNGSFFDPKELMIDAG